MKTFVNTFIGIVVICVVVLGEVFFLLGPVALGLALAGAVGGVIGLIVGLGLAGATLSAAYERWS